MKNRFWKVLMGVFAVFGSLTSSVFAGHVTRGSKGYSDVKPNYDVKPYYDVKPITEIEYLGTKPYLDVKPNLDSLSIGYADSRIYEEKLYGDVKFYNDSKRSSEYGQLYAENYSGSKGSSKGYAESKRYKEFVGSKSTRVTQ